MSTAFPSPVRRENLSEYEQGSRAKQKELLERYRGKFKESEINHPSDIEPGDHLISKGCRGKYTHHMLCTKGRHIDTKTGTDSVKIIEYTGPNANIRAGLSGVASKDLSVCGKVVEQIYPVQELLKKKVLKIVWPDEIDCFPATEVIKRARSRKDEPCYDFLKNNCEHFVTWCKCGLNVSLQVKSWYVWARDLSYSVFGGLYDSTNKGWALLIMVSANASDEVLSFICANIGWLGFGIGILIELGWARYQIEKALLYHNKTEREFRSKLVEIFAKAICRLSGGIGGSLLGLAVCPAGGLLSSFIGGAIGAGLGHLLGVAIAWCFERFIADYFD